MTPRQRWLAAVRMHPVDRLPFWPKLNESYPRAQPAPFDTMTNEAIHDWIGSDQHVGVSDGVRETRRNTSMETVTEGTVQRVLYRTPHGTLERILQFDEPSQSWHPTAFPVRRPEDIDLMIACYEDIDVELDRDSLQAARDRARSIGDDAVTTTGIGESPLMHWVEWLAGVECAHYLLADCRAAVEALFAAMHRVLLKRAELMAEHSPADLLYLVENTSTTLISPAQYKAYCLPHIGAYAAVTSAADRNLVLHMCGHLKALLPDLDTLPVQAFEAFTSPTLGDTTLLDGRTHCPEKCLIGGTNAMLWTKPAKAIIAQLERDLDVLPHHRGLVVTSAGVMPPLCRPETIREVGDWVKAYPARTG